MGLSTVPKALCIILWRRRVYRSKLSISGASSGIVCQYSQQAVRSSSGIECALVHASLLASSHRSAPSNAVQHGCLLGPRGGACKVQRLPGYLPLDVRMYCVILIAAKLLGACANPPQQHSTAQVAGAFHRPCLLMHAGSCCSACTGVHFCRLLDVAVQCRCRGTWMFCCTITDAVFC